MFDWTKLTKDPTDKAVNAQFCGFLQSLLRFYTSSRNDFLRDYCRGRRVLDIGAGEHDPAFYHVDKWEHGIIASVASRAVAAEIHQELCDFYNSKGFHFRCVDATSDTDLGEKFDRVFIGDVIEHVNNPVLLLQFAKRHLADANGRILISTPNPFALSWFFGRLRKKHYRPIYLANFEHVSWVTPTNANEIARRAGLTFSAMYFPKRSWGTVRKFKDATKALTERLFPALGLVELGAKEYIYEFTL